MVRHASAVVLEQGAEQGGRALGVLIEGPSGTGKSALALRLMALGARLVADDRTRITAREGWPWLLAPERLDGVIERASRKERLLVRRGDTQYFTSLALS